MDTLFNTNFENFESSHFEPQVKLRAQTYDLQESNVRLRLTVVNTVGFGDQMNKQERWVRLDECGGHGSRAPVSFFTPRRLLNSRFRRVRGWSHFYLFTLSYPLLPSYQPVVDYIDRQFETYRQEELKIKRSLHNYHDSRVHACLYFISPSGHSLKSLDLVTMKKLDSKVPPVSLFGLISMRVLYVFVGPRCQIACGCATQWHRGHSWVFIRNFTQFQDMAD